MAQEQAPAGRSVNRRRLLRKAGTMAAGVAGAGVVGAVAAASPASANNGDSLVLGSTTNAQTSSTVLTNTTGTGPALQIDNQTVTSQVIGGQTLNVASAPLTLVPHGDTVATDTLGNIGMSADGTIWAVDAVDTSTTPASNISDYLYTTGNAMMTIPVSPFRVLSTTDQVGQVLNASGNIYQGRLLGNHSINIDLTPWVNYGYGVIGNLTTYNAASPGYLTVYPYGATKPSVSNVDYNTSPKAMTGAFICSLGVVDGKHTSVLTIYANTTVWIMLDIQGFIVGFPGQVNPSVLGTQVMSPQVAGARKVTKAQMARLNPASW